MNNIRPRLVVIPSDPISAYEKAGYASWLEAYYNPQKMFDQVFAISPLEKGEREAYGMTILGVKKQDFVSVLRDIQPSAVRAYGGFWPSDLACRYRLPHVPVIISVHDTTRSLLHKSVCYADLVICVSKAVERQVRVAGVAPSRIRILPNRIDTDLFRPINDDNRFEPIVRCFPRGKYILHVGRKSHEKNLDTVIQTLKLLPSDYLCVFVGPGDSATYENLAEKTGVSEQCFWIESIRNEELPLWYSWCDCMCTPSRWEGFGIVFIEAAACGAAIVTSDIAPMNEYLVHDNSAFLVKDYENPVALANAIRKVCEDIPYHRAISAGAVKAAQPFDRKRVDAAEAGIYLDTINSVPRVLSLVEKADLFIWQAGYRAAALSKRLFRSVMHRFR